MFTRFRITLDVLRMNVKGKYKECTKCFCNHELNFLCYRFNSQYSHRSTIYALSTATGMSAIAVVRISGPSASSVLYKIGNLKKTPEARKAVLCNLQDPDTGQRLDKAIILWFPSPNSYTGEDLCELHIHGGKAVINSILRALYKLPHFRLAEPGEFTKRAFIAEKLDLTEVEGLVDLLHAETEAQQRQALRQIDGALHKLYNGWSSKLKKGLAQLEAYIDFSEDQHLEEEILTSAIKDLDELECEIRSHLLDKRRGEKLRSGIMTVLLGKPNVGKSSLLNFLCQREIAIVSSTPGTTRDLVESSFNLDGYLVNICDTAGLRLTSDDVEEEGINRAKLRSSTADLIIFVIEAKQAIDFIKVQFPTNAHFVQYILEKELGNAICEDLQMNSISYTSENILFIINKCDLLSNKELEELKELEKLHSSVCIVSCLHGSGMNKFIAKFAKKAKDLCSDSCGEEPGITQERHRHHVQSCIQHVQDCIALLDHDIAVAVDHLRKAMNELGKITGRVSTEDILNIIFKDFCIGK